MGTRAVPAPDGADHRETGRRAQCEAGVRTAGGLMGATDRRVREAFIELADTLVTDFDIIDFLGRLAVRCTELLGVSACGVMLADYRGVLNLVAASTEEARLVELAQLQAAEGPCVDAYQTGRPVQKPDLN